MSLAPKRQYLVYDDIALSLPRQCERWWPSEIIPAMNISENDREYQVDFAAPGFQREDFHVSIKDHVLQVSVESLSDEIKTGNRCILQEYKLTPFTRTITLPDDILEEEIKATYESGILKIVVGKVPRAMTGNRTVLIK
jgi:HSP20 family protein